MAESKTGEQGAAFAKDLGYLGKFFDKLDAHAANLPTDDQGRYRELISEERTRWDEISGILTGAPSKQTPRDQPPSSAPPEKVAASPQPEKAVKAADPAAGSPAKVTNSAKPTPRGRGRSFTVGSLKRR